MSNEKRSTGLAVGALVTAIGIVLFWMGFFTIGLAPENPPICYFAYEHAFPFPDVVLAVALLVGGLLTLKGARPGALILTSSAGALIFLGLLDVSFNVRNGIYWLSVTDLILNGLINLWCIGFGALLAVRLRGKIV